MFTKNINFKNFNIKKSNKLIKKDLKLLLKENSEIIRSLSKSYKYNYEKKTIKKIKNFLNLKIIGMGGSTLGAESIYSFLKDKIKKKFTFINNLNSNIDILKNKKEFNLIISKSGNTLETIVNSNILINSKNNLIITENRNSYLFLLAKKLKTEIVSHNNFIGGRYSVLSEVGMLPAELMGLNVNKFKQLNSLIKNKNYINLLTLNVANVIHFIKQKKYNSIIINYDQKSEDLFKWYQQLVAESLGKNGQGVLPIISTMPKDNHSVMQLYLDGPRNNFFTFFNVKEKKSNKIINEKIFSTHNYLKGKNIDQIISSQKKATEQVFIKKKIPFRSFDVLERDEKSLGELFCFFILETILIGRALNINPYDQPAVEMIKKETKKMLI
tara:strand:- start:1848 stop:2999 length:1152 start_codon:yes stop_codon:yes gene_type:complete